MWRAMKTMAVAVPLVCSASLWAADEPTSQEPQGSEPVATQPAQQANQEPTNVSPEQGGFGAVVDQQLNQTPEGGVGPGSVETDSQRGQAPQGPDRAFIAGAAPSPLVAYQPIPESMLPVGASQVAPVAPGQEAKQPTPTNLGGAPIMTMGPYTLGRDDVVHVSVRGQPDFTGTYVIGPGGTIQYGFVGDVMADGLTKEQLADILKDRLSKYIRVPVVNVTIVGFNSKAIYILGRVARPGKYAMRGDTVKIRDAVIAAGLVVRHAKLRSVHIIKSDPKDPSYKIVDLQRVLYKGQLKDNIDLINGDIVVVPTTVWGAVNDFLGELVNPVGHAGSVAALAAL